VSFRVKVDPANPGQFFACCGLLEIAARLRPGAEGCFDGGQFAVSGDAGLRALLSALLSNPAEEVTRLPGGPAVKALLAPLRLAFGDPPAAGLVLDAWVAVRVDKGKVVAAASPPWNFWSGQQTPSRIWTALRAALSEQLANLSDGQLPELFGHRVPLTGRFGFDPGAAWNALDVGFSPNEQGMEVASSPAVELLAAVGVQRFRPVMAADRQSFTYATWGRPLGAAGSRRRRGRCGPGRPVRTLPGAGREPGQLRRAGTLRTTERDKR
jgi:CRISPR-associated protein Csx14